MRGVVHGAVKAALSFAFVCRFTNADQNLGKAAPAIAGYFKESDNGVLFAESAYVQAYFGWQGQQQDEFIAGVHVTLAQIADHRSVINSTDLFGASYGLLKSHKNIGSKIQLDNVREVILATASAGLGADARVQVLLDWAVI